MASAILWSFSCYGQLERGLGEVRVGTVLGIQDGEWRLGTSMYSITYPKHQNHRQASLQYSKIGKSHNLSIMPPSFRSVKEICSYFYLSLVKPSPKNLEYLHHRKPDSWLPRPRQRNTTNPFLTPSDRDWLPERHGVKISPETANPRAFGYTTVSCTAVVGFSPTGKKQILFLYTRRATL